MNEVVSLKEECSFYIICDIFLHMRLENSERRSLTLTEFAVKNNGSRYDSGKVCTRQSISRVNCLSASRYLKHLEHSQMILILLQI